MPDLHLYQRVGANFLATRRRALLADEAGVGKTATALATLAWAKPSRALIVCPLSVVSRWVDDAAWAAPNYTILVATGTPKRRRSAIEEAITRFEDDSASQTLLVTNYETCKAATEHEMLSKWLPNAVVCDESHRLKSRRSKTFEAIKQLTYGVPWLFLVTGSPVLNRPEELWAPLHLIDPIRWSSYWGFVSTYCETELVTFKGQEQPTRVVKDPLPGAEDQLRSELRDVMIRRELSEVLPELPDVTEILHRIDLTPTERRLYDQMARHYFAEATDADGNREEVIAVNDATKVLRLRQLCTDTALLFDHAKDADPAAPKYSSKIRALVEIVEDLRPEPVIVFDNFRNSLDRARQALTEAGLRVGMVVGGMSGEDRTEAMRQFQAGALDVICGTIGALGVGVDLYRARHVCFLGQSWVPEENSQAIARSRRQGQTADAVFSHVITASNSIDQYVRKVLSEKRRVIDALVGAKWKEVVNGG